MEYKYELYRKPSNKNYTDLDGSEELIEMGTSTKLFKPEEGDLLFNVETFKSLVYKQGQWVEPVDISEVWLYRLPFIFVVVVGILITICELNGCGPITTLRELFNDLFNLKQTDY